MRAPAPCPGCSEVRHLRPYWIQRKAAEIPVVVNYCDGCADAAEIAAGEGEGGGFNGVGEPLEWIEAKLDGDDTLEVRIYGHARSLGLDPLDAVTVARNSVRF